MRACMGLGEQPGRQSDGLQGKIRSMLGPVDRGWVGERTRRARGAAAVPPRRLAGPALACHPSPMHFAALGVGASQLRASQSLDSRSAGLKRLQLPLGPVRADRHLFHWFTRPPCGSLCFCLLLATKPCAGSPSGEQDAAPGCLPSRTPPAAGGSAPWNAHGAQQAYESCAPHSPHAACRAAASARHRPSRSIRLLARPQGRVAAPAAAHGSAPGRQQSRAAPAAWPCPWAAAARPTSAVRRRPAAVASPARSCQAGRRGTSRRWCGSSRSRRRLRQAGRRASEVAEREAAVCPWLAARPARGEQAGLSAARQLG